MGKNNELPQGWINTKLDFISIITSGSPAPQGKFFFDNDSFPFVRVADMGKTNTVYLNDTRDHVNELGGKKLKMFPKGSVLFTKSGASTHLNQKVILGMDSYVVSHIGIINSLGNIPDEFIYYFLKTIDFKSLTHESIMPSLQLSKIKTLTIPLPPLTEQKRIVEKIKEYFSIINNINSQLLKIQKNLIEIKQSSFKTAFQGTMSNNWRHEHENGQEQTKDLILKIRDNQTKSKIRKKEFTDFPFHPIPHEWMWIMVHEISSKMGDAPFGTNLKSKDYVNSGIPVIHGTNIKNGKFHWKYHLYVSKTKFDSIPRSQCKKGDLAFQKIGATIGKCAFLPKIENHENFLLSTNMMYVRTNPDHINVKYVYYYFQQKLILDYIRNSALGTAQPIFNYTTLKNFQIPIPITDEQNFIVMKLDFMMSFIDKAEIELEKMFSVLNTLKNSVLQQAFEGKLVPQDPNDEPASELLKRIKLEE